jgi:hypothetical protein
MMFVLATIFCAAMSALNIAFYVTGGGAISLAAAVFCGFMALINIAQIR